MLCINLWYDSWEEASDDAKVFYINFIRWRVAGPHCVIIQNCLFQYVLYVQVPLLIQCAELHVSLAVTFHLK